VPKGRSQRGQRLVGVHLRAKVHYQTTITSSVQSAWMLASGMSPVADVIEPVHLNEVVELIQKARERWKDRDRFPGVLRRRPFSGKRCEVHGSVESMYAVCKALSHSGKPFVFRIDPSVMRKRFANRIHVIPRSHGTSHRFPLNGRRRSTTRESVSGLSTVPLLVLSISTTFVQMHCSITSATGLIPLAKHPC